MEAATSTRNRWPILACWLALGGAVSAQVFEVGDDGTMREAPGLGGRRADSIVDGPSPADASTARRGRWVVQLGAYPDLALLDADWQRLREQHADLLAGHNVAQAAAQVGGRSVIRLAVIGIGELRTARSLCAELRRRGADCFVRSAD